MATSPNHKSAGGPKKPWPDLLAHREKPHRRQHLCLSRVATKRSACRKILYILVYTNIFGTQGAWACMFAAIRVTNDCQVLALICRTCKPFLEFLLVGTHRAAGGLRVPAPCRVCGRNLAMSVNAGKRRLILKEWTRNDRNCVPLYPYALYPHILISIG